MLLWIKVSLLCVDQKIILSTLMFNTNTQSTRSKAHGHLFLSMGLSNVVWLASYYKDNVNEVPNLGCKLILLFIDLSNDRY